jgi:hypothetical protein
MRSSGINGTKFFFPSAARCSRKFQLLPFSGMFSVLFIPWQRQQQQIFVKYDGKCSKMREIWKFAIE